MWPGPLCLIKVKTKVTKTVFGLLVSTSFIYTVNMNVWSVHHSLSDDDAIADAWRYGLPSGGAPSTNSREYCVLYIQQCQFDKIDRMPTYCGQIIVFVLAFEQFFLLTALWNNSILTQFCLITLHTPGYVDSFNALIAVAIRRIWWQFVKNF